MPGQLSSMHEDMISVPEHPVLVLHCQLCSALRGNRGFNLQPREGMGYPHTHPCTGSTNPDFEKSARTLVLRNALLFLTHLSYPPSQSFNDHDIRIYLLL